MRTSQGWDSPGKGLLLFTRPLVLTLILTAWKCLLNHLTTGKKKKFNFQIRASSFPHFGNLFLVFSWSFLDYFCWFDVRAKKMSHIFFLFKFYFKAGSTTSDLQQWEDVRFQYRSQQTLRYSHSFLQLLRAFPKLAAHSVTPLTAESAGGGVKVPREAPPLSRSTQSNPPLDGELISKTKRGRKAEHFPLISPPSKHPEEQKVDNNYHAVDTHPGPSSETLTIAQV